MSSLLCTASSLSSLLVPLIPTMLSFLLILIAWTSYHEALRSPQPRIPRKELSSPEKHNVSDVLRVIAFMLRTLMVILGVCEVWALCVAAVLNWSGESHPGGQGSSISASGGRFDFHLDKMTVERILMTREICPSGLRAAGATSGSGAGTDMYTRFYPHGWLPLLAALGLLIQTAGAYLRIWSQRTLGRFFTWELTIFRGDTTSSVELKESGRVGVFRLDDGHQPDQQQLLLSSIAEEKRVPWGLGLIASADPLASKSGLLSADHTTPMSISPSNPGSLADPNRISRPRSSENTAARRLTNAGVEHKLITCGPYAFVRHPGYSGALFLGMGQLLFGLSSGTYLNECVRASRVLGGPWRILDWAWIVVFVSSIGLMISRSMKEDEMLRREFGREWDEWARETRWRLIPYVF